jgi:cleavage and polyadenylation specificity factor subunit 3
MFSPSEFLCGLIPGLTVWLTEQGTLAAELLTSPREILASDGRMLKVRCSVNAFSFSAHADYSQTSSFVEKLAPAHVVLCHGNTSEMERLRKALTKQAASQGARREIHAPKVRTSLRTE